MKVYTLHENPLWIQPLLEAFAALGVPHEAWHLDGGALDLGAQPPQGVFYNRMSASAHTRGHRYAPEYASVVLDWLESHGRPVVNGARALHLEVTKMGQYAALAKHGVAIPRTISVTESGENTAIAGAVERVADAHFPGSAFILKPNRGGRGQGVVLLRTGREARNYIAGLAEKERPLDGTWLVQQRIIAPDKCIIRCEFVGGRFLYAVRVDASHGFELCPADVCAVPAEAVPADAVPADAVPVGGVSEEEAPARPPFEIITGFASPLIAKYEAFLAANDIGVAGIEMIIDGDGVAWTYDVNTNTNYNAEAERAAGFSGTPRAGMMALAGYLGERLGRSREAKRAAA